MYRRNNRHRSGGSFGMNPLVKLIGALLLTYFASRLTRCLPIGQGRSPSLLVAHSISFGAVVLAVAAIKLPQGQFTSQTLGGLLAAQLFWLVVDGARKQLGAGGRAG